MHESIRFPESIYTFHIDANGHVSNIVYIQWMEIGRLKLLETAGFSITSASEAGVAPFLLETQIQYRRPLQLGDTVEIEVWLSELTRLHAWMEFAFRTTDGEEVARGRQRGVFVDVARNRPTRLPEEKRELFLPYLAD